MASSWLSAKIQGSLARAVLDYRPLSSATGSAFLVAQLNSQVVNVAIQRRQGDVEPPGCFLLVWTLPQDALNVLFLEALDGFSQVIDQARVALNGCQVRRQIHRR